jgi:AcrR family transcriptional regulator
MAEKSKWTDEHYLTTYRLRRDGLDSKANLARALGVSLETINRWFDSRPALVAAWETAAVDRQGGRAYREYIFQRMPARLQAKLAELTELAEGPVSMKALDELFTFQGGEKMRQHLFLHSWVASNYNASEACKFVGISKHTLDRWVERDIDFAQMVEEVRWHRKNFIEGALMGLVARGDTAAVIYANRTQNVDRGYGKTTEVNINHSGTVQHSALDIDKLNLPMDVKLQVLEAIREANREAGTPGLPGAVTPVQRLPEIEDEDEREAA